MAWCSLSPDGARIVAESRFGLVPYNATSRVEVAARTGAALTWSPDLAPGGAEFARLVRAAREHVAT